MFAAGGCDSTGTQACTSGKVSGQPLSSVTVFAAANPDAAKFTSIISAFALCDFAATVKSRCCLSASEQTEIGHDRRVWVDTGRPRSDRRGRLGTGVERTVRFLEVLWPLSVRDGALRTSSLLPLDRSLLRPALSLLGSFHFPVCIDREFDPQAVHTACLSIGSGRWPMAEIDIFPCCFPANRQTGPQRPVRGRCLHQSAA